MSRTSSKRFCHCRNYINTFDGIRFVGEVGAYISIYDIGRTIIGEIVGVEEKPQLSNRQMSKPNSSRLEYISLTGEIMEDKTVPYTMKQFYDAVQFATLYEGSISSQRIQEYTSTLVTRLQSLQDGIQGQILTKTEYGSQINIIQLMTFYSIGRWIVEEQQQGKSRAKYGQRIIKRLSEALTEQYGKGLSEDTLKNARKFYLTYSNRISETVFSLFAIQKSETVFSLFEKESPFTLSWSHYLQLMRIKDENERKFYEIEATNEAWGIRTLQRQYNSSLYERLALSREKDEVLRLASEGNVITKPQDIVKQPTVLEFLGLDEKAKYVESDLETAIINKLQKFLLELGKGYLFEARQKRFTFKEDNYYVDLVFYNRLLRCYVLIDLKIDKLTHQDLGQMLMYVHYYDRYEKLPEENPTVGILICKEKDDALVEITLPDDANIYASEYQLYLPDKKELQKKLKEWIEEGTDL